MNTFSKTFSTTSIALLTGVLCACATPTDESPEGEVGTQESPITFATVGRLPRLPVGDLVVADPDTWTAKISGDDLYGSLLLVLGGSRLVIDTTGTSPTIPGEPFYHCTYPNQQVRAEMQKECYAMAGTARSQCLKQMNEDYPNIKQCGTTTGPEHSYIDFGPLAESYGAKDTTFDIATIHRDSWGPGSIDVDINYVRTTVGPQTIQAGWVSEGGLPTADLALTLTSNQPTAPCAHSEIYLGCPDVELTNMKVNAKLTGIAPSEDKKQLAFGSVIATFAFDMNLNNVPDAALTVFVDVQQIIKNNVQSQVKKGLEKEASRTALNKALTALAEQAAKKNHATWNGVKEWRSAALDNGSLVVRYVPN